MNPKGGGKKERRETRQGRREQGHECWETREGSETSREEGDESTAERESERVYANVLGFSSTKPFTLHAGLKNYIFATLLVSNEGSAMMRTPPSQR